MSKVNSGISGAATGALVGGPWGAALGGAAGLLLGKDDNSSDYYQKMLEEAQKIPLPELKQMNPELYKAVVQLNPELEQNVVLGPSATEGIALDPRNKQAQMQALSKLMDITSNNGEDVQFKADSSRLQNDVNANLQGNTAAIQQNMAARGLSGGTSELLSKQLAAQQAANRQAQMGMDLHAQAQQRALSAIMNQGQIAGQIDQADFNQQNTKAQSQDAISRFNAQNLQNVNSQNTQNKNQALQWNAQNTQSTSNSNVGVKNAAQQYNNNLPQQQFDNQLKKTGLISSGYNNLAQNSYNQAKDQDQFLGGLFGSVAKYGANKNSGGSSNG